jgi:hypothetical protein
MRVAWLKKLAAEGRETYWRHMPRSAIGRWVSNRTWGPMIEAGWSTGRYGATSPLHQPDWIFEITDAWRGVLLASEEPQ